MNLVQTSFDQTGIAIVETPDKEQVTIPLFSLSLYDEANEMITYMEGELKHVFITNNLIEYKIEDEIRDYQEEHNNVIPEEYMDELASGIPFVQGLSSTPVISCYI